MKNWKTTLCGVALFVSLILNFFKLITIEQLIQAGVTLAAINSFFSKDFDKTGKR